MAAYDINTFNNLRQLILDKIVSEETVIQNAYFEQRPTFEGSPVAVIGVSNNEALYSSQCSDRMTFVFQVLVYIPIPTDEDVHVAEINMGKAYWEVLHMFNQRNALSPIADIVEPLPSSWGFEERSDGLYRYSEINIKCVVYLSNKR